jgi:hypothetical protein
MFGYVVFIHSCKLQVTTILFWWIKKILVLRKFT